MKKYILYTLLSSFLFGSETNLQTQIDELKKEIQELKNLQEQDYEELYKMADKAESNSFADRLKFGLGFRTTYDNMKRTYADGHSVTDNNSFLTKVMLNFSASITNNMKFHGRLSMFKYWGNNIPMDIRYQSNKQARVPTDSTIYAERAYLDWYLFQDTMLPIAITIGRQASGDGPSSHFKENTTRKANYSALLYDTASDDLITTLNLSKILNHYKTYLHIGYVKGFNYVATESGVSNPNIGPSNDDLQDTYAVGAFLDTTLPNIRKSLVQLSYSKVFDMIANPLDTDTSVNTNIGDIRLIGAMVEVTNLYNSNLDLFAHYGHSTSYPNGKSYSTFGGLVSKPGDDSVKNADAFWLGTRYGFGEKQKYKIGFEYNQGSRYWINLTQAAYDVYNKLAVRGHAYEIYGMYVINKYSNLRLGVIDIDYKYSLSSKFVGEPVLLSDLDSSTQITELRSFYLKMSVNF